jgi:hypothetical protein
VGRRDLAITNGQHRLCAIRSRRRSRASHRVPRSRFLPSTTLASPSSISAPPRPSRTLAWQPLSGPARRKAAPPPSRPPGIRCPVPSSPLLGRRDRTGSDKTAATIFSKASVASSPELRREIHEGLQVVENWNSANGEMYYREKDSELTGADREHQEVSMLALHGGCL